MFEQLRRSLNELLERATKPEDRRAVLTRMKGTLVQVQLGVNDLRDGLQLTQDGYLKPAFVAETFHALGWEDRWIGKANREDLTYPVADIRVTARALGLVNLN